MNNSQVHHNEEDYLDLKQFFTTLFQHKKIIIITTLLVTLLATLYAYTKTPIYEAKALIEIGNYKHYNKTNSKTVLLNNPHELAKKLEVIFIDIYKNSEDKTTKITSIRVPKMSTKFLYITAEAISNELAKKEIEKVLVTIQHQDNAILSDVKNRRELKIKNIEADIQNIRKKEVVLIEKKIQIEKKKLQNYTDKIKALSSSIQRVQKQDATLAAILLLEQSRLSDSIYSSNIVLIDLQNKKESLLEAKINTLLEQKQLFASMLLPHNYRNSQIVARIITSNFPSKPRKKIIIIVSFITGLILSIFLVFLLEFLAATRVEETK